MTATATPNSRDLILGATLALKDLVFPTWWTSFIVALRYRVSPLMVARTYTEVVENEKSMIGAVRE